MSAQQPKPNHSASNDKIPWDEVIPGIDPETKAIFEKWNEIYDEENEVPVVSLLDPPLQLPEPGSLTTDEQAAPHLAELMDRMMDLNLNVELCNHMTPLSAYHLILTEFLPTATIHPELASTKIIENYCLWEHCPKCRADLEAEYGPND